MNKNKTRMIEYTKLKKIKLVDTSKSRGDWDKGATLAIFSCEQTLSDIIIKLNNIEGHERYVAGNEHVCPSCGYNDYLVENNWAGDVDCTNCDIYEMFYTTEDE